MAASPARPPSALPPSSVSRASPRRSGRPSRPRRPAECSPPRSGRVRGRGCVRRWCGTSSLSYTLTPTLTPTLAPAPAPTLTLTLAQALALALTRCGTGSLSPLTASRSKRRPRRCATRVSRRARPSARRWANTYYRHCLLSRHYARHVLLSRHLPWLHLLLVRRGRRRP